MKSEPLTFSERWAKVLDSAFVIPGTRIRFGLDPILGLIPGFGDVLATFFSSFILVESALRGAPLSVLFRMVFHIGIDLFAGSIPLLGDVFDVAWKANLKNSQLLRQYLDDPSRVRSRSRWIVASVLLTIVLSLLLILWIFWKLLIILFSLISNADLFT